MTDFIERLTAAGIERAKAEQMWSYAEYMLSENEKYNLTAITEPIDVAEKHFIDSIFPAAALIPKNARVIDVGAGGGFPGIPLKLMRPDIKLTALDATRKKIDFIKAATELCGLSVNCVYGRVEELAELRESFDIVVTRAVARLPILIELCVPLLKVGGALLAYKSDTAASELADSKNALKLLACSGKLIESETAQDRYIVKISKYKATLPKYPRRYAQIKKSPL